MRPLCIVADAEELIQGLFGQTFYYLLQLLPYLAKEQIYPQWDLCTLHYGAAPRGRTVPGVLDLAYEPPPGPYRRLSLCEMRRRHAHVLGNDWAELNSLWSRYFRIPSRVLQRAEGILPDGRILGVHYRGTDKQTALWDSNPISQVQYIALLSDFLKQRGEFKAIFAASDEPLFIEALRRTLGLPVLSLEHHGTGLKKADDALLDCVLLSRCDCVVETSSALPSFAKLLNPTLEIYRSAASKLFGKLYTNMPYFPVAHIPVLPVTDSESVEILRQTMQMDWTQQQEAEPFLRPFVASPRWQRNHEIFRRAEKLGIDRLIGHVFSGYR